MNLDILDAEHDRAFARAHALTTQPGNSAEAAAQIITWVREHLPESQDYSLLDALWLAFLGLHGPAAAAAELRSYLPMMPSR